MLLISTFLAEKFAKHDHQNETARSELDDEAIAYVASLRNLHTIRLSQVLALIKFLLRQLSPPLIFRFLS